VMYLLLFTVATDVFFSDRFSVELDRSVVLGTFGHAGVYTSGHIACEE